MKRREMRILTDVNENSGLTIPSLKGGRKADKYKEGSLTTLNFFRIILLAAAGLAAPIVQEAFFNNIRLFGVKPNIAAVIVFIFSAVMEPYAAMIFGALEGIYVDIMYGRVLGVFGLLFTLLAFACSCVKWENFKKKTILSLAVSPAFFFAYTFTESLVSRITHLLSRTGAASGLYTNYLKHIAVRILPVTLYDCIVLAVLIFPYRALWKAASRKRNKKMSFKGRTEMYEENR